MFGNAAGIARLAGNNPLARQYEAKAAVLESLVEQQLWNLNPFTGDWHARSRKLSGGSFNGRGDHYNHSAFADLIITGLAGLRPRADNSVDVNPLPPPASWDWFCLNGVPYHGRSLTSLWDREGRPFGHGGGLSLFADGRLIARASKLQRIIAKLP